jgi:hypothetical protein
MNGPRSIGACAALPMLVLVLSSGCGGAPPPAGPTYRPEALAPAPPASAPQAPPAPTVPQLSPSSEAGKPLLDVDLVPSRVSPAPGARVKVSIEAPGFDQLLPSTFLDKYKVRTAVKGIDSMPPGSYVQLLLDGRPFRPLEASKGTAALLELAPDAKLAEGEHLVAAVAARPNHESVKAPDAVAVTRFWTGKKTASEWKSTVPMLLVTRPHGTYKGSEAEDILIDFYPLNVVLGDKDYFVRLTLKGPGIKPEGMQRLIMEWRPYSIISAHAGDYSLALELCDKNGNVASGPWGSVARTFKVDK